MPDPTPATAPAVTVLNPTASPSLTVNNVMGATAALPDGPSPVVLGDGGSSAAAPSTGDPVATAPARGEPAAEPAAAPAADPAAPAADPAAAPAAAADPDKNKSFAPDAIQRRINEITAKRYEAERQAAAAQAERDAEKAKNVELRAQLAAAGQPAPAGIEAKPATQADIEALVEQRAMEKAQQLEFNKTCNTVANAGKSEFKDTWDQALNNLGMVGLLGQGVPVDFLQTAVELQNPAKILHHLGTHLDEADRVAKLPTKQQAIELARLEAKLNSPAAAVAPAPLSNAPPPVVPVTAQGVKGPIDLWDANTPSDAWYEERSKQLEARKKRYMRS